MVDCRDNGSQAISWDGSIYQVLSIPAPPGMVPVIPKYVPCQGPSLWKSPGSYYCRITTSYGPWGVEDGVKRWGRGVYDPVYGAIMPYLGEYEIHDCIEPKRGLEYALSRGDYELARLLAVLRREGIGVWSLGLTGSRALGIAHEDSDVDLVVYEGHEKLYHAFRRLSTVRQGARLGGVITNVKDFSWRKATIAGVRATWIPAANLCPAVGDYFSLPPPSSAARVETTILPLQQSALGYPPCARSESGVWIVSFEFNLAGILYEGGRVKVEGMASSGGDILYVGLREFPGKLIRLRPRSYI